MIQAIFEAIIRRRKISAFVVTYCRDRTLKTGVRVTYPFFRYAYSYVADYREAKLNGGTPTWQITLKSKIMLKILHVQWRIFKLAGGASDD